MGAPGQKQPRESTQNAALTANSEDEETTGWPRHEFKNIIKKGRKKAPMRKKKHLEGEKTDPGNQRRPTQKEMDYQ